MSHYTVAIFTEDDDTDIDDILAPYDESISVAPYVSSTKEDLIKSARERMQAIFETRYKEWQKAPATYEKTANPEHIEYLKSLPKLMIRSDAQVYRDEIKGYESSEITSDGGVLSTYNPNSKWDWYETGGRWHGMLMLKEGCVGQRGTPSHGSEASENYDAAWVKDIDFDAMAEKLKENLPSLEKARSETYYTKEYFDERYPTEADYIKDQTNFTTYAVITPNGQWHEPGKMGWWGMSSATTNDERTWADIYYERFLEPAIENGWYVTIVDCHI